MPGNGFLCVYLACDSVSFLDLWPHSCNQILNISVIISSNSFSSLISTYTSLGSPVKYNSCCLIYLLFNMGHWNSFFLFFSILSICLSSNSLGFCFWCVLFCFSVQYVIIKWGFTFLILHCSFVEFSLSSFLKYTFLWSVPPSVYSSCPTFLLNLQPYF